MKLTNELTAKYDPLNKEYGDKISAIAQDATLSKKVQKEKEMGLKKEKEIRIFECSTPKQQTTYKELVEKRKNEKEKPANG